MLRSRCVPRILLLHTKSNLLNSNAKLHHRPADERTFFQSARAQSSVTLTNGSSNSGTNSRKGGSPIITLQQQREQEGLTQQTPNPATATSSAQSQEPLTARRPNFFLQLETRQANKFFKEAQSYYQAAQFRTLELLNNQTIGSWTETDWWDANDLMYYWCNASKASGKGAKREARKQQHESEGLTMLRPLSPSELPHSVSYSLSLVERMLQEQQFHQSLKPNSDEPDELQLQQQKQDQQTQERLSKLSKTIVRSNKWLERIAQNWNLIDKKQAQHRSNHQRIRHPNQNNHQQHQPLEQSILLGPEKMLQRLETLASQSNSLLRLHPKIYNLVMDVTIRQNIRTAQPIRTSSRSGGDGSIHSGMDYTAIVATPPMMEAAHFIDSLLDRMLLADIEPDGPAFYTVLAAWAMVADGHRAQQRLQQVCDLYSYYQNDDNNETKTKLKQIRPSRDMFHYGLEALSRGPKSSQTMDQCYSVLRQMEYYAAHGLYTMPNARTFNLILTCLAHNPHVVDPVAEVERLFEEMTERDKVSYNIVLEMYAKRGMAQEAESLLKRLVEEYDSTQEKQLEPQTKSFNFVLSAWSKVGNHGAVEQLFETMEQLHATGVLPKVAPDRATYSILLDCWMNQVGRVPDACERAEAILHTMKRLAKAGNYAVAPTTYAYTTLMKGYAKVGNPQRAEELLGEMMDELLLNQNSSVRPDLPAFNMVLYALSRSDQHDAVDKIKAHINRMKSIDAGGVLGHGISLKPDARSYNYLLQAIARSGRRNAGEECEQLVKDTMMKSTHTLPDITSYTVLVQAYTSAGKPDHAERIVDEVLEAYFKLGTAIKAQLLRPTVQIFTTAISAWANHGSSEAPERADALLKRMTRLAEAKDLVGSVDRICYNALLTAWSKSGRKDAVSRVEAILKEMEDTSSKAPAPDTITYNIVLSCYAAVGDMKRCQMLFERMNEVPGVQSTPETLCTLLTSFSRSETFSDENEKAKLVLDFLHELQDSSGIKANAACFNVVLNCLADSMNEDSAQVAEDLMLEMERLGRKEGRHVRPKNSVKPDTVTYATVIKAFANVGNAEKAEKIMEQMIQACVAEPRIKPNTRCFNTVLKAWAQKVKLFSSPDAPARAEAVLDRMRRLHKSSGLNVMPDVISYNTVLGCHAKLGLPSSNEHIEAILKKMRSDGISPDTATYNVLMAAYGQKGNLEGAENLLKYMLQAHSDKVAQGQSSHELSNLATWNFFLNACAKSRSETAVTKIENALATMDELYSSEVLERKPNVVSFNCYLQCLAFSNRPEGGERCEAVLRELQAKWKSGDEDLKPSPQTYGLVIRAWLLRNNCERAQKLLFEMCTSYENGDTAMKPYLETFRSVLDAVERQEGGGEANAGGKVREKMKMIYPELLDL